MSHPQLARTRAPSPPFTKCCNDEMREQGTLSRLGHRSAYYIKQAWAKYRSLTLLPKLIIWGIILFNITLLVSLVVIGPAKVTQKFYDAGQELVRLRFGWMILGAVMIVISFPPLTFYWTTVSLCGFTYGLKGIFLAAPATMIGSTIVFVVLRFLFKKRLNSWTTKNEKWQALETVIRKKGLLLIILIRVSPFPPWAYSNAFFSSIEAVSLWQFIVANFFLLPKLLLVVFAGSRVAKLADGEQRGRMDTIAKVLNVVLVVISIALGVLAGVITYKLLQRQIKELRESPAIEDELAAEAIEEAEEGAPLLQNVSSDSLDVERQ